MFFHCKNEAHELINKMFSFNAICFFCVFNVYVMLPQNSKHLFLWNLLSPFEDHNQRIEEGLSHYRLTLYDKKNLFRSFKLALHTKKFAQTFFLK